VIFVIVQPPITLLWEKTVTVPLVARLPVSSGTEEFEWYSALERVHLNSIRERFNIHPPVPGVRGGMIVTIVHENSDA